MQVSPSVRGGLAVVAALVGLLGPGLARADERDEALVHYREAQQLAGEKRWAEAADHLGASLALHRSAGTLYSLGLVQLELGKLVEARASFLAFLAAPPTASSAKLVPDARERIAKLDRRVARATILLEPGSIAEPTVELDGVQVPAVELQKPLVLNPGVHELVARAKGRTEAHARVVVSEGGSALVTLTLAEGKPALAEPARSAGPVRLGPDSGRWRVLPWVLVGSGAAVFGAGLTVGLLGWAQARGAPTADGPEAHAARAKALGGDVLGGLGVAAAGVGLVLLLVDRSRASAAVGPVAAVVSRDVGLWWRF